MQMSVQNFKNKCHFAPNKYTWIFGRIGVLPEHTECQ